MTKTLVLAILIAVHIPTQTQANTPTNSNDTVEVTRRKVKPYRKKKGFLWGLFRKKSNCDCPKH